MSQIVNRSHPFTRKSLLRNGFFRSLFGRKNPANAMIELNNALAGAARLQDVTHETIGRLNAVYRTDIHRHFRPALEAAYAEYMTHCLRDRQFSQEEVDGLWHLQGLFCVLDPTHNRIYEDVGGRIYRASIKDALRDSKMTKEEKVFLDKLSKDLELSEDVKKRVYTQESQAFIQGKADAATSDNMLSPQEEEELQTLAKSLDATIKYDGASQAVLQRCRLMWRIRCGEMPTIPAEVNLQRAEVCYFTTAADWHETRRVRTGISYAGPTMRIKIAKGLYWRMGHFRGVPMTNDTLMKIDSGTVYLTNKRIIFAGTMKNASIKLDKILDITPYSDGVGIQKDSGKSPILGFTYNIDIFCAMLARAISDYGR